MQNLYNNGGFYWWNGVVEDRQDPLLLGRCRVRILGYHNPNKVELPTEDLPWAYPVQPITSAAMNGIGHAPVGPVEGTWVVGFFRDGDDCQEPIIFGTLGGVPQVDETLYELRSPTQGENGQESLTAPSGEVYVNKATNEAVPAPSPETVQVPTEGVIGPLSQDEVDRLLDVLATQSPAAIDINGNIGGYKFTASQLADFGYIVHGANGIYTKAGSVDWAIKAVDEGLLSTTEYETLTTAKRQSFNFFVLATDSVWTQKAGKSASAFLKSAGTQDVLMQLILKSHFRFLFRSEVVKSSTPKGDVAGYLSLCHFVGQNGAREYRNGIVKSYNDVTAATYFNLGFKAVGGVSGLSISAGAQVQGPEQIPSRLQPSAPPTPPTVGTLTQNTDLVKTTPNVGFADPNKVYPKTPFVGEPDTNRLARHQKIALTVVGKKDAERLKGVELANSQGTWDQPAVPYNSKYPFNHVQETESGHIIELDDTAGNERIHLYHKSGTFTETDANGTRVTRIVGDDYAILERNGYIYITGKANVNIGSACNVRILGDCNVEIDGVVNALLHNDVNVGIAGNLKMAVEGTADVAVTDALKIASKTSLDVSAPDIKAKGDSIQIKSEILRVQGDTVDVKGKGVFVEADNDLNIKAGAKVNSQAGTEFGVKSGTKLSVTAGTELGLKATAAIKVGAGAVLGLDGAGLALLSGVGASATPAGSAEGADSADEAKEADAGTAPEKKTATTPTFPELQVPARSEELAYVLDGLTENIENNTEAIAEVKAKAIADGTVNEEDFLKEPAAGTEDKKEVAARKPVDGDCGDLENEDLVPSFKLSEYFTIGMLSSGAVVTKVPLQEYHGLSKAQIACNLRALATQVLDPIREHYPNMIVTSGFRTSAHSKAVNSQHEFGCAADLQFCGVSKKGYLEIAQWIRDNVPFDQLLLEYKSFGTGNPWIHISYNRERLRAEIRTMWNDRSYPDPTARGLVDLSGGA